MHNEVVPSSTDIFLFVFFSKLLKWLRQRSLLCATRPTACTRPWRRWSMQIRLVDCLWTPSIRWSLNMTTCSMLLWGCCACCRGRNKDCTDWMLFLRRQWLTVVTHCFLSIISNCKVTEVYLWAAMNMARVMGCCLYNTITQNSVNSSCTVHLHRLFMDLLYYFF